MVVLTVVVTHETIKDLRNIGMYRYQFDIINESSKNTNVKPDITKLN